MTSTNSQKSLTNVKSWEVWHSAGRAAPSAGQGHTALTVIRSLKIDGRNQTPALPAAIHRMIRKINVSKESRMIICGQGVAGRWARADGGLRGRVAPCPVESRSARTGAGRERREAVWRRGWEVWMHGLRAGRVRHNCWPCARRSRAGRCGRGEAAHPQSKLAEVLAVDASRGRKRPRQQRCV